MAEEITDSQVFLENTDAASNNEQAQGQDGLSPESIGIPEKFVGKSVEEVAESYVNLEKQMSKIQSERAAERKNREDLDSRYKMLESNLQILQHQLSQQPQHRQVMEPETDPISDYEKTFDEDPKKAVKDLVDAVTRKTRGGAQEVSAQVQRALVKDYHERQIKENPEYKKLLPKMQSLAAEYNDLVRPEKSGSIEALKLLQLLALGATRDEYVQEAISKAKQTADAVKSEKRNAFSESSQSTGDSKKLDFSKMSSAEMAKYLPRAD